VSQTAAQICELARQIAKVPKYLTQSGQILNFVLEDLCQNYNLEINRVTDSFSMNTTVPATGAPANALSADWLRSNKDDVFYTIQGVNYFPIQDDQAQFDKHVLTAGLQSYPGFFFVDTSVSPSQMYFWPPPSGAYAVTARYFKQRPDITTPETATDVPWFPNTKYLVTAVAGGLMQLADDERADSFLSDNEDTNPQGAGVLLRKYLKMQGDSSSNVKRVTLDRQLFGTGWNRLPNTKNVGW
jgi:hypothetical protein